MYASWRPGRQNGNPSFQHFGAKTHADVGSNKRFALATWDGIVGPFWEFRSGLGGKERGHSGD